MHHLRPVHWNLTAPFLYEHAVRRGEGDIGFGGAFVANTGRHTGRSPRDKYIVNEPGTKDTVDWGDDQPADRRRRNSTACSSGCSPICRGASCSCRISMPAPIPNTACRCGSSARAPGTACSRATCSSGRARAELADFQPAFTILHAPDFQRHPATRRHPLRDLHLRQFRLAPGADRRHPLCRRDQEIGVRLSEFRAAGARRAADALLGQCRAEGRLRDLFRPVTAPARRPCRPTPRAR